MGECDPSSFNCHTRQNETSYTTVRYYLNSLDEVQQNLPEVREYSFNKRSGELLKWGLTFVTNGHLPT